MLKLVFIPVALLLLGGCGDSDKPKEASQGDFRVFMEYHNKECRCTLDGMPSVKRVLQKDGPNTENLFCLWNAFICTKSKSTETLKRSVQIMDGLGEFSCDNLDAINNIAKEQNVDALCAHFWTPAFMTVTRQLVHLTYACERLHGGSSDCICAVMKYIESVSNEDLQYERLSLGKMRDAAAACAKK